LDTIKNAFGFSAIGKRYNNQDSIYPYDHRFKHQIPGLYIVADGVGGERGGGMASYLAIEEFTKYLHSLSYNTFGIEDFLCALDQVDKAFEIHRDSTNAGMSTTFVFAYLHNNELIIGHIGDSKYLLYQNGKCIVESKDHTLVQLLLDQGHITKEEALNHPKRNHVSKVIRAGRSARDQLELKKQFIEPTYTIILATDGVFEAVSKKDIDVLVASKLFPFEQIRTLKIFCEKNSKDNASCVFIELQEKTSINRSLVLIVLVLLLIFLAIKYLL